MTQPMLQPPEPQVQQAGRVVIDANYDNRSILTPTSGFIKDYTYTLNPYSGCAFGCQYCYAVAFVPGPGKDAPPTPYTQENWGNWVRVKRNAVPYIARQVAAGKLNCQSIYMSSVTDPYQPTERRTNQTGQILAELAKASQLGLVIQTRGTLADNDEHLAHCARICDNGGRVQLNMTITTNDEAIRKACEPTCPAYRRRLETISSIARKTAHTAGYTTCITMTPLLPTDYAVDFANDLIESGVKRFIIQPTHTGQTRPGRFRAATRNKLAAQLAEHWRMGQDEVPEHYQHCYKETVKAVVPALEQNGALVGFGQPGFARPWRSEWHTDQSQRPAYLPPPPSNRG